MRERFFTIFIEKENERKEYIFNQKNWSLQDIHNLMLSFKARGYKAGVKNYGNF